MRFFPSENADGQHLDSSDFRRLKVNMKAIFLALALAFAIVCSADSDANDTRILLRKKQGKSTFATPGRWHPSRKATEEWRIVQFVLDFAVWSEWDHIVLFVPVSSALLKPHASAIYTYFNAHEKFISIHSTSHPILPRSLYHTGHRLGVVLLWDPHVDDFLNKLIGQNLFSEYRTWLFVNGNVHKEFNITRSLSVLNISIVSNAVVCIVKHQQLPTKPSQSTKTAEYIDRMYYEVEDPVCIAENLNEKWYRKICTAGATSPGRIRRHTSGDFQVVINLYQIFKVSKLNNSSLVQKFLGFWDPANGMVNSVEMLPIEKRFARGDFSVVIGLSNSTSEVGSLPSNSFSAESDEDEDMHMKEVLECLMHGLNGSREILQYAKLGWRNEEGGWTHLLGAVAEGVVDFALDTININVDMLQEMSLTHPIIKTMNNIYFKRPNSGGMRDIFLAPFDTRLLASVFVTAILLALAKISVTITGCKSGERTKFKESRNPGTISKPEGNEDEYDGRKWETSEAALWSVSVICMQGSPWRPNTKSGSMLLLCSLLFALVIYNSYAAFITSVLSVKNAKIKNLEDLINSNFAFGYTLGNADELFLRTVNDSLLRKLYFKGLKENDGVSDPMEGMHRAGNGEYAFFVAARMARRALLREVAHRQRCGIQEMMLPVTKTVAAIPVSRHSPYKKLINYRILKMMEAGILKRLQNLILPPMPKCLETRKFNSARLLDVYSAFYMLLLGWMASGILIIMEIIWQKRSDIRRKERNGRTASTSTNNHP